MSKPCHRYDSCRAYCQAAYLHGGSGRAEAFIERSDVKGILDELSRPIRRNTRRSTASSSGFSVHNGKPLRREGRHSGNPECNFEKRKEKQADNAPAERFYPPLSRAVRNRDAHIDTRRVAAETEIGHPLRFTKRYCR